MTNTFKTLIAYRSDGETQEVRFSTIESPVKYTDLAQVFHDFTEDEIHSFFNRITGPPSHWTGFTEVLEDGTPVGPALVNDFRVEVTSETTHDDILDAIIERLENSDYSCNYIVSFDATVGEMEALAYA